MNILCHYGVKGIKWGVRRYQNKDGTLTNLGKSRKNMDAINNIVSTMSKKDKELLNLSGDVYQRNINEGANVVKRIVKKVGDIPVSFLDITGDRSGVSISIGTRGGDEYRNKGYASAVAKKGKKWLDEHADEFDQVVWWTRKDNPGSIKIAQKIGLELDESSVLPDNPWIKYERKKISASILERTCRDYPLCLMGGGVGLLLICNRVLGNEALENRNGVLTM